jgi:hypothetical protein
VGLPKFPRYTNQGVPHTAAIRYMMARDLISIS